jgi:hypothetical protein
VSNAGQVLFFTFSACSPTGQNTNEQEKTALSEMKSEISFRGAVF